MKLLAFLLLSFPLWAQTPAPPETKPEDLCVIEGQVISAATGAPIPKAEVSLRGMERATPNAMPATYGGTADAGGNFSIRDVEPGKYRLTAQRTGFVTGQYGAHPAARGGGTPITLTAGERMKDVAVKLSPQAVITGRVTDQDNDPVANATVRALRYTYQMGRRQLIPTGYASTNDLGEFRMHSLEAGKYFLAAAREDNLWENAIDASVNPPPEDYVTTYYPGTKDIASAVKLDVAAGAQLRGINLTLVKARTYHVRGRLQGPPGAQVGLMPRGQMPWSGMNEQFHGTGPKGSFDLRNVLPGAYVLTADSYTGGKNLSARQEIDVGDGNVDNLVLTLAPGIEVTGVVSAEGNNPPNLDFAMVTLQPRDHNLIRYGGAADRVRDGAFTLSDIAPGLYYVDVRGLPDGYWVKSVQMGGQELRGKDIDLTSAAQAALNIMVAPGAGQIDGSLMNDQQQPALGATVVLVPAPELRDQASNYKTAVSDQTGHFTLKNLPPGDYKLFAWEDIEYGAYMDPDFLKPFEDRGQSISIAESSRESVQLNVIAGDSAPATRKDQ